MNERLDETWFRRISFDYGRGYGYGVATTDY
jgi:hypothetical protein